MFLSKKHIAHKRLFAVFLLIAAFLYTGIKLSVSSAQSIHNEKPVYSDYAGSATCFKCHAAICDSQMLTAHYSTSHIATKDFIKGSFEKDSNTFIFNKFLQVKLEGNSEDKFYQTAIASGVPYESQSFDISVGSGYKGQTYLYWNNATLYQLPISFYTPLNSWCNSPGYPNNFIKFDRVVTSRCMECHATFASFSGEANNTVFDSSQIIYGITCERCHGPAAKHVAYYSTHDQDTLGRFILKIKYLSREQKLDACAICHSGIGQQLQPSFSFQTGDKLDNFSVPNYSEDSAAMLDVHGNQFGLLTASKCFINSQLTCSSCHNVHQNETGLETTFAEKCISCHQNVQHKSLSLNVNQKKVFNTGCISCHMPLIASKKILLQFSGKQQMEPDYVRTHFIKIYPDETKQWLEKNE